MNTLEFMTRLRRDQISLTLDGDQLRCKAPKGVLTAERQRELSLRKGEIVAFLQQTRTCKALAVAPLQKASPENRLSLSPAQQRLWFMDRLEGGCGVYNEPAALAMNGLLNVAALEKSLGEIVGRHESLRTVFSERNGSPIQVIRPPAPLNLIVVDLNGLTGTHRSFRAQQMATAETRRPFHLEKGPLLRFTLVRLQPNRHILLTVMHHIISDGWSMSVLIAELKVLYRAYAIGNLANLPPLPLQYADFAAWQVRQLETDFFKRQLAYWRDQLRGAPVLHSLPTDRPRPAVQSFRGDDIHFEIDGPATEAIKRLGRSGGATVYMTLLAVCKILLSRYSGEEDILVGSLISGRNRTEIQNLIGFFSNTLALRTDLTGDPTFLQVQDRIRAVVLDAYSHQDIPFEQVVEALQPRRNPAYNPVFQIVFVYQSTLLGAMELPGLSLDQAPLEMKSNASKFDLVLSFMEGESGIHARFEYSTDLFDRATMSRFVGHFKHLLADLLQRPALPFRQLALVPPEEQVLLEMPTVIEELGEALQF